MKKIWISIFSIAVLAQFGCKKTFDINKNPNFPEDVTVKELLPAAELSIAQQYGNYFQIAGGIWSQYWTQSPNSSQYRPFEQYNPGPSTANTAWSELYAGALMDLNKIVVKADTALNTRNYTAIAKILQGFTYQLLTDNFGDIPFSEALKAVPESGTGLGNLSPKYDKQQDVYAGIIKLVKEGRDMITFDGLSPEGDDIILQGDMATWGAFANTLLLRMYLRISNVNPGMAMQGITELQADQYGFLTSSVQINYSTNPGNTNPLYSEMVNLNYTQNLIGSTTAVDSMVSRNDPRVFAFYTSTVALPQGYYSIPNPGSYGTPSSAVGGTAQDPSSALAPVKLISSYESLFLQAEATVRMGGDGSVPFAEAIQANMDEYEVDPADATQYLTDHPYPVGGSMADQIKAIITEKWYAMNGNQNIEAWTEWRRTGYPDFFVLSRNSRIGNNFPARFPYPETEVTRNANFPGQKQITDKVWWDVN